MTIITPENRFNEIRPGDEHFTMNDGIKLVPRAMIEISQECPEVYKSAIIEAYQEGWLTPVACVKTKELFWEVLEQ